MKDRRIKQPISDAGNGAEARSDNNGHSEAALKIEQSIGYMKQHLDKPLQVAGLAAQVSISPSHYFALFKRCTGSAPIDYFTRLRMHRACELLDCTELSVKEIATTLGYEDPFYFSRVFKSINRVAPSDYRVSHKSGTNGVVNSPVENLGSSHVERSATETGYRNGDNLKLACRFGEYANGSKLSNSRTVNGVPQGKVKI